MIKKVNLLKEIKIKLRLKVKIKKIKKENNMKEYKWWKKDNKLLS